MSRTSSIANSVLTDISTHLDFLPTPLHADFLPLPYIAALHAIRVSIAWRQVTRGKGSEAENEGMRGLVGYLVMAFGGSTITSSLLSLPPPILTSPYLLPFYSLTFLLSHYFYISGPIFSLPANLPLDLALAGIDAIARTLSIISLISSLAAHPQLAPNPWPILVLAPVAAAGGGVVAGMFGLYDKEWTFRTPACLSHDASFLSTLDLSSAVLVATVYSLLMDIPSFRPFKSYLLSLQYRSGLSLLLSVDDESARVVSSQLEARTIVTLVLGVLLGGRVLWMYYEALRRTTDEMTAEGIRARKDAGIEMEEKTKVPEKVETALVEGTPIERSTKNALDGSRLAAPPAASPRRRVKVKGKKA